MDPFTLALIGGGVMAATGIGSSVIGGITGQNAANAQARTAREAMAMQERIADQQQANYLQQRRDVQPWLDAGRGSLADLVSQMQSGAFNTRLDPGQLASDPGFQFRMEQGQRALERSAAARGGLNSGKTMMGLARFSQGLASDEYQNAWNRNQADATNRFNRLASMAGVGQQAGQALGSLSSQNNAMLGQHAGQMANLYGAAGNAQSAGQTAVGNAFSNGLGTIGNLGGMAFLGGMSNMYGQNTGQQIPNQAQATQNYGAPASSFGGYPLGYVPRYGGSR